MSRIPTRAPRQLVGRLLPDSGQMGTLRKRRPQLYRLAVITTYSVWFSLSGFLAFGTLVALGCGARALQYLIAGEFWSMVQWFLFAALALALVVGAGLLAAKWAGRVFADRGGDD